MDEEELDYFDVDAYANGQVDDLEDEPYWDEDEHR